ncbi:MAG: MFS transporter [Paraburkholderia fungorum]|uniref:MFS transporter n=1 Tax=Paraburkholderia agricolaris TaxID=2152888 RepID=A0ABW8ZJ17_9BURK|nr:MFS transporter [Paraburkholderia fungorum]
MTTPLASSRPAKRQAPFGFRFVAPLALGSTLNPINSTMIATALVPIAADFHASVAETGWLIAGLYLTSAVAQPTMGRLADLFGPRRVYLASLLLIALAGLVGGIMPSLGGLVAVRVMLGIGTSGAYPSAMRIFRVRADKLGCEPPATAMGVLSMGGTAMLAIGPFLGGVLTSAFGWHAIFAVNVPFALGIMVLVFLWVPKDDRPAEGLGRLLEEVDLPGIGLFTAFLLSLMIFLLNLNHPIWIALPVSVIFCAGLILHSRRRAQPFIDVRMLARNRALSVTYLRAGIMLMMVYCILYGFAQWLESAAGFSEKEAGLITMPMSIVAALSSLAGTRNSSIRMPFLMSIGSSIIGCACLLLLNNSTTAWLISIAVIFFAAPQGMFATATQTAVYMQARAEEIGTAAGLQRTAQYIGAIAATSLLGLVYGQSATDQGLHRLALVMGVLGVVLFVSTIFDRTISRPAKR